MKYRKAAQLALGGLERCSWVARRTQSVKEHSGLDYVPRYNLGVWMLSPKMGMSNVASRIGYRFVHKHDMTSTDM